MRQLGGLRRFNWGGYLGGYPPSCTLATGVFSTVGCVILRVGVVDVDDPVVEIADPSGNRAGFDVMSMVDTPDDAD